MQSIVQRSVRPAKTAKRVSHNLNGQRLGRKGRDTRERILAATRELLGEAEPLSLSAVARRASLGMTSIYGYFADLTELLLALLDPVSQEANETYLHVIGKFWPHEQLHERCAAFVQSFFDFWTRNSDILHLRNSLSDQRDRRMMVHRVRMAQPVIRALIGQMGHDPDETRTPAVGMATTLYTGLDRIVAIATDRMIGELLPERFAPDVEHFLKAEARLLELGIREHRAPA